LNKVTQKITLTNSTFNTERLNLIPASIDYLDDFHEYSILPQFYKYIEYEPFKKYSESKKYLEKLILKSKRNDCQFWFIQLKSNMKVIGTIGFFDLNTHRKSLEIGYGLSPNYWGNGYFSESLKFLIDFAFSDLKINRISAKTFANNKDSVAVLEKSGFKSEGILRDFYYQGNDWHDCNLLSILNK